MNKSNSTTYPILKEYNSLISLELHYYLWTTAPKHLATGNACVQIIRLLSCADNLDTLDSQGTRSLNKKLSIFIKLFRGFGLGLKYKRKKFGQNWAKASGQGLGRSKITCFNLCFQLWLPLLHRRTCQLIHHTRFLSTTLIHLLIAVNQIRCSLDLKRPHFTYLEKTKSSMNKSTLEAIEHDRLPPHTPSP